MEPGESVTRVVILGSTGSIGRNTLNVIEHDRGGLVAWGLSAHRNWRTLVEQASTSRPLRFLTVTEPEAAAEVRRALRHLDVEIWKGATVSPEWFRILRPTGS